VDQEALIARTIELARTNVEEGGRPFACVVARDGEIVGESPNRVAQTHDPTAHAEVLAIRAACIALGTEHLEGCDVYALAHPCPMCLGALYYCSPDRFVFVTSREDYVDYYRDDRKYFELDTFYAEFAKPYPERRLPMTFERRDEALGVYRRWAERNA
jgi:guanine deaminase